MSDEGSKGEKATQFRKVRKFPPPLGADSRADAEKEAFDSETNYKERQRGEKLKDVLHWLVVGSVVIVGMALIVGIVVWAWHVLAPDNWHWLSSEQISDIQSIMSSGLLALVVSDYAKKYVK